MKLAVYAKQTGISYKTAYRWYKAGTLTAQQLPSGTIIVRNLLNRSISQAQNTALCADVNIHVKKLNLTAKLDHYTRRK